MRVPTDQDLDVTVAGLLRAGVSLAALVVFAGGVLLLRHPGSMIPDYAHFHDRNPGVSTIGGILQGTIDLSPQCVIQFGLILLVATPVARVAFCVVGFARQKSALYVVVSSLVLSILIYSLVRGGR